MPVRQLLHVFLKPLPRGGANDDSDEILLNKTDFEDSLLNWKIVYETVIISAPLGFGPGK